MTNKLHSASVLAIPTWLWCLLVLVGSIMLVALKFWFDNPVSNNPYIFYERNIKARIGAYAPYAFMDKGGTLDGYVMDLTYAISRVMGSRIILVSRKLDNPDELKNQKDADVILCIAKTPANESEYLFTEPYARHSFSVFGRPGEKLPPRGRYADDNSWIINRDGLYYELYHPHNCAFANTAEEALHAIAQGANKYTIMETYIGNKLIDEQSLKNVVQLGETGLNAEYSFGIHRDNPEAFEIFSNGLAYLKSSGQFERIQNKWLEKRFLITERKLESIILYALAVLLIAGFLASLPFIWVGSLKRQVQVKTADLEKEIHERKKYEKKLIESQSKLVDANKRLVVGTLASGIAHEINNPNGLLLMNIGLFRDMINDIQPHLDAKMSKDGDFKLAGIAWSKLRGQLANLLDDSLDASLHIRDIVKELKDFVGGDVEHETCAFSLETCFLQSRRFLNNTIKKCTDRFSVEIEPNLPLATGNPRKIGQVIINLVINACQALTSRDQAIIVKIGLDSKGVFFKVIDQGKGIKPEELSRICDPFFTTKRPDGGTGLGLSISAHIIKTFNGELDFVSSPGKGTTACFHLQPASPQTQDCDAITAEEH